MVNELEEGLVYTNPKNENDYMILGIYEETDEFYLLAVLEVDRDSSESIGGGELTIYKEDLSEWSLVEDDE